VDTKPTPADLLAFYLLYEHRTRPNFQLYQNMKPAACMITNTRNGVFFCVLSCKETLFKH